MSHSTKLIDQQKQQPNSSGQPILGVGGTGITRDSQPSALQKQHLQHIVGSGRNSVHGVEDRSGNPFGVVGSSNLQGPLAQKRQNTGQRIIEGNNSKSIRSTKNLPLSSHGQTPNSNQHRNQAHFGIGDYNRVGGPGGIPKPSVGSAAQRRSNNGQRGVSGVQYNSTSAAGYQSKQHGAQSNQ